MAKALTTVRPDRDTRLKISRLKLADKTVKRSLRTRINRATKTMPASVKESALRIGGGQLSQDLAGAVGRRLSFVGEKISASIFVKANGNLSNLARAVEGVIPWHHPTFGHAPERVQAPKPFFFKTLERQDASVTREIEQVLDDLSKAL